MEQEPLIEAAFLIPIREDRYVGNGRLHPHTRWQRLTRDLYHMFEGWSLIPDWSRGFTKTRTPVNPFWTSLVGMWSLSRSENSIACVAICEKLGPSSNR